MLKSLRSIDEGATIDSSASQNKDNVFVKSALNQLDYNTAETSPKTPIQRIVSFLEFIKIISMLSVCFGSLLSRNLLSPLISISVIGLVQNGSGFYDSLFLIVVKFSD